MYREGDALMLRPWDPEVGFVMGKRAGAAFPDGAGGYWPFRMLTGDGEKQLIDRIHEKRESSLPR